MRLRIAILGSDGMASRVTFNALRNEFDICAVVIEEQVRRSTFLKRRINKLGWRRVTGQVLFTGLIVPFLNWSSKSRINEIMQANGLSNAPLQEDVIRRVTSVNSEECVDLLRRLAPDIIVLAGTRIVSDEVLMSVQANFLNMHAGITPLYRGVHGGYWSLVNHDREHCGVTVHLVDKGIDTGKVIHQTQIRPSPKDNFSTYPVLQLAEGLSLLKRALREADAGRLEPIAPPAGRSQLWSHPTFSEYCLNRLLFNVK